MSNAATLRKSRTIETIVQRGSPKSLSAGNIPLTNTEPSLEGLSPCSPRPFVVFGPHSAVVATVIEVICIEYWHCGYSTVLGVSESPSIMARCENPNGIVHHRESVIVISSTVHVNQY